jgi:molybdopterin-guanine dinucleotide biosynthesis protein A
LAELAPLRALLLVGGQSARMGRPKQLVSVDGEAMSARVARAVAAVTAEAALGGAGEVPDALHRWPRLADAPGVPGPLAAIVAALRAHPDAAWLVVACDLARITDEAVRWLAGERRRGGLGVIPRRDGRPEPLFAVYEPAIAPDLEALAQSPSPAPRRLAELAGVHTPEVPPAFRGAFTNVNTPADLARIASAVAKPRDQS